MGRPQLETVSKDEVMIFYKANSFGEIVGIYNSVSEFVELEKKLNPNFQGDSVRGCLNGKTKYFRSFHHQCKVRPVIRKRIEVKHLLMFSDIIINTYCDSYGISPEAIKTQKKEVGGGRVRKKFTDNGELHIDYMRMSLGHYFAYVLRLPAKLSGVKAGYVSHSTVIHNRPKMIHYISTKDPYVYPYWERLMQVVKLYQNETSNYN